MEFPVTSMIIVPSVQENMLLDREFSAQDTLEAIAALSGEITRLSSADAEFFRAIFQQEGLCYSNSWLYLLRATRDDLGGFGYKLVGQETVMGIGYRNNTFYLVHPVGNGRFEMVLKLCRAIQSQTNAMIVLKKVDQELYERLYATDLFCAPADGVELFEEEAFPEHILPLEALYNPQTGIYNKSSTFTRKVKRFARETLELFTTSAVMDVEGNAGFAHIFADPEKYKSYRNILHEVGAGGSMDSRYTACTYCDVEGTIHGLYVSEWLAKGVMGLYCAVSSKGAPGITEWMDYDFFKRCFQAGAQMLYLGGSETVGVDAYVKKLFPIIPTYTQYPMLIRQDSIQDGICADPGMGSGS